MAGRAFIKTEDGALVNLDRTDRIYVLDGEVLAVQEGGRSISVCRGGKDEIKAVTSELEEFMAGDGGVFDAPAIRLAAYMEEIHPSLHDGVL